MQPYPYHHPQVYTHFIIYANNFHSIFFIYISILLNLNSFAFHILGGDYAIPLQGHCLEPKPQGPYTIKAGGSINIPFRNIFHQTKQFSFSVDNPAFTVKPGDNLKPRKIYNILVHFDAKQADTSLAKVGKLIVSSVKSGGATSSVKWTYYLKGL